jgi:hypothetical protein
MDPRPGDWPSSRWRLTAPESYVLQRPRPLSAVEAFKLALRELVLRRALRVERLEGSGLLSRRRPRTVLRAGPEYGAVSEAALRPLLELHARVPVRRELDEPLMEDFAKEARREFSRSLAGYVNDWVYASLVDRGLMRVVETTRLGLFRRRRRVLTPDGQDAAAELDDWLRVGRDRVEDWARSSPDHALAYAGGAGAAILLMPELYPEFEQLGRRALTQGEPAATVGDGSGPFDFGLFGGGTDGGGFDSFDAFDSFDSIDAGVDAGVGWGGGGGGDGGGGGNGGGG